MSSFCCNNKVCNINNVVKSSNLGDLHIFNNCRKYIFRSNNPLRDLKFSKQVNINFNLYPCVIFRKEARNLSIFTKAHSDLLNSNISNKNFCFQQKIGNYEHVQYFSSSLSDQRSFQEPVNSRKQKIMGCTDGVGNVVAFDMDKIPNSSTDQIVNTPHDVKDLFATEKKTLDNDISEVKFDHTTLSLKTTGELLRTIMIFSICKIPFLVERSNQLISLSKKYIGKNLTNFFIEMSLCRIFCGGINHSDVVSTVRKLSDFGIKSILNYSAEMSFDKSVKNVNLHEHYNKNYKIFVDAIDIASHEEANCAAIKCSSLTDVQFLTRVSNILRYIHETFAVITCVISKSNSYVCTQHNLLLDKNFSFDQMIASVTRNNEVDESLKKEFQNLYDGLLQTKLTKFHGKNSGMSNKVLNEDSRKIDYFTWIAHFNPDIVDEKTLNLLTKINGDDVALKTDGTRFFLDKKDQMQWNEFYKKMDSFCQLAKSYESSNNNTSEKRFNVKVLFDAEQTFVQPAVDYIVWLLQLKHNGETGIIFNTFQAYLKDVKDRLNFFIESSLRHNFFLSAKLVRGAYMSEENRLAEKRNISSPINSSIEATHHMYDSSIDLFVNKLQNSCATIFLGTHNENSIKKGMFLAQKTESASNVNSCQVLFAQLYGMCDHFTHGLARNNMNVYKFVPYGPVDEVMPYLLRRIEENSSLLNNSSTEVKLSLKEVFHRFYPFFFVINAAVFIAVVFRSI